MSVKKRFSPKTIWDGTSTISKLLIQDNAIAFYDFVQRRKGYVYAMAHPTRKELLKVGLTAKNPYERAKTLETAGVLGKFDVLWMAQFANVAWAESQVHLLLKPYHEDKEFFATSIHIVKDAIHQVLRKEDSLLVGSNIDKAMGASQQDWLESLDTDFIISLVS